MRHRYISLSSRSADLISYSDFGSYNTNASDISKMKKILQNAIANELTDKQRYCVREYYFNGRNMKDIADDLCVNPSTVTRHIQGAKRRLKRVAMYY